ncbi:DUF5753 domain-containing protein [Lentzea sp. DG1S-22]|uniref:DUF5753 domain-containing protein n=1 Tax=Lentzea sp. DG1S-22 TaxID=3108822 RepID=UPI002E7709B2|nr:DUF5753 domain-containing protein [Lentzea sp. DG1S-22]WVH82741.1 DUF5753 domain-containing protein [Lentzea sp. DG1S-22]
MIAEAGFTGRGLAEVLDWQEAKLSDLVNGKGGTDKIELALLLGALRAAPAVRKHLQTLFPDVQVKGWWQQYGSRQPVEQRTLVSQLAAAEKLVSWHPHAVPDALRTTEYRRAVIAASATVPAAEVEDRLQAELIMQRAVFRGGLHSTFFIHEAALRLPVGSEEVQAEQIQHLLRMSVRPSVSVRIFPERAGAHAGMFGPFLYLDFTKFEPLVCLMAETSTLFVEETTGVKAYRQVIGALDRAALGVDDSHNFLLRLGGDLSAEPDHPSSMPEVPEPIR